MTHPNWFADDAETTGTIPAAPAVDPVESPTAKLRAVATAVQSTLMPDDTPPLTAGPGPLPAELSNPAMDPAYLAEPAPLGDMVASDDTAEVLHALACACPRIDDRPYHQGYDFHELAGALEARVLEQRLASQAEPAGRYALEPAERFPVEAKVKAGAWGGATATLVATVATAILGQFDTFRPLFGNSPWSAPLVLVVGAALTAAQTIAAYQAPHSPRCGS